jgi:uncharacterized membrane protein
MTWNRRYQVKSYLRSALWVVPLVALTLEQVFWALVRILDYRFAWKGLALGVTGAEAVFNAVTTLTLSFIVFTFGSLLVAIQVAGGQYTPRIIATTLLRDNVMRYTVGLFVFTFIFAVKAAARTEMTVHQLVAFVTGLLGLSCIVAFLFLIDYAARMLRPVSLVKRVGENGLAAIESVYPEQFTETQSKISPEQSLGARERTILHRGKSAIVIAVNVEMLVAEAEKANGVIEFAPHVVDFVGSGGRSNKILSLLFESWSTSRSRHCRRRSMIRRQQCWRSINFTSFCEGRECGICVPIRFSIKPGIFASSSGPLTGRILLI